MVTATFGSEVAVFSHLLQTIKGWGLSRSWDAYNDGSVNPPWSVYNITTAICIEALVKYQRADIGYHEKEVDLALDKIFHDVLEKGYSSARGMFYYSPRNEDHHFVHNVNSYMSLSLYQYLKYRSERDVGFDDTSFLRVISNAAERTWDDRFYDSYGTVYFSYHHSSEWNLFKDRPNDLKHSMYTMRALYLLTKGGVIATGPTPKECIESMKRFVKDSKIYEWSQSNREPNRAYIDARLWGVGMLIVFINDMLEVETREDLTAELSSLFSQVTEILFARYAAEKFRIWRYRPASKYVNLPRHLAHVFRGLSYSSRFSTTAKSKEFEATHLVLPKDNRYGARDINLPKVYDNQGVAIYSLAD